jgi:hypothetical protein
MGMTKGMWRRSRAVNNSRRRRMVSVPTGLPGTPNGVHLKGSPGQKVACNCGGCSGKR